MESDLSKQIPAEPIDSAKPQYSISKVSEMTGISAFTLRYYDQCGFFPNLFRDKHQVRRFSESDIAELRLVDALKKSGLSIEGIKYFVRQTAERQENAKELHHILQTQETALEYQIDALKESSAILQGEKALYKALCSTK
jgi:DNA-binding transcriptional MerR regulator